MAKDDNGGLLSKVVKFVRNPTTNWADLDTQDSDKESSYSKQMLKEMIERKRRNDFVRKREFDMLRKLRRSEAMAGQDPTARPSFFQSSMPSKPDDRAMTLKKIDEIEAQMSMQWWKTKHGDSTLRSGFNPSSRGPLTSNSQPLSTNSQPLSQTNTQPGLYGRTEPAPLPTNKVRPPLHSSIQSTQPYPPPSFAASPSFAHTDPTAQAGMAGQGNAQQARSGAPPRGTSIEGLSGSYDGSASGFTASKLFAVEVDEFAHDPELEEAAIRFANGDDKGAEAGLLEVLGPKGARVNHEETWMTLFDLYRATGQVERFESAAIDFAGRFGRSAPAWFSIADAATGAEAPAAAPSPGTVESAHWQAKGSVGLQSVAALSAALMRAPQPWRLDWSAMTSIEVPALEPLCRIFAEWAGQPVQLRFMGIDMLDRVLKAATPSSDKRVNPNWWRLRMEALRVMHRPDEFELVALDYCVTYEVSPPSWESARCDFRVILADGSTAAAAASKFMEASFRDSGASGGQGGYAETQMPAQSQLTSHSARAELAGQVLGDASEALDIVEARLTGADVMTISCARLVRIDFSAAGTLLNWVTSRQAEGRQVQFVGAHRLIAAFFNVIGISEHARIIPRVD